MRLSLPASELRLVDAVLVSVSRVGNFHSVFTLMNSFRLHDPHRKAGLDFIPRSTWRVASQMLINLILVEICLILPGQG